MGTVEINGKSYNTNSQPQPKAAPRFVDGFRTAPTNMQVKTARVIAPLPKTTQSLTKSNHLTKPLKKSQTLHRKVVKKPQPTQQTVIHKESGVMYPSEVLTRTSYVASSPHEREQRATATRRSELVAKFGRHTETRQHQEILTTQTQNPAIAEAPPLQLHHVSREGFAVPEDLLIKATTKEPHTRKKRLKHFVSNKRKFSTIAAGFGIVLLIGGFIAYQNLPAISMRVAASRAGFDASTPGAVPSGFSFKGPIAYAPGQVIISFQSNTDERAFQINQRPSEWNSQTLLDNFVTKQSDQYQSFQEQGLTIYLYENSNATWVNKGIWYTLEGRSSLGPEQIINIATSM